MILLIQFVPDALSFLSRYLETHVEVPCPTQQSKSIQELCVMQHYSSESIISLQRVGGLT